MTTLEKLLRDAQQLLGKMKQNDTVAENITEQFQHLNSKIEAGKKFQEVPVIAEDGYKSKQNLNLVLLPENPHIRDLENENKELRNFLDEHQAALELIMSKYRHHVNKHLNSHTITLSNDDHSNKFEVLEDQIDQINDMKNMMWKVLEFDEPSCLHSDELTQLQKENSTLLQLLHISRSFGNNCIFNDDNVKQCDQPESTTCFEKDQITSFICNSKCGN